MRGHTVRFYATRADLLSVLDQVAKGRRVRFFPAGVFDSEPAPFDSYEEIPSLGQAQTGDATAEPYFLVVYATDLVTPRSVHLLAGGTRVAIDQLVNPSSDRVSGRRCTRRRKGDHRGRCGDDLGLTHPPWGSGLPSRSRSRRRGSASKRTTWARKRWSRCGGGETDLRYQELLHVRLVRIAPRAAPMGDGIREEDRI